MNFFGSKTFLAAWSIGEVRVQAIAVARRGMRYAETLDEPSRSRHLEELQSVLAEAEAHNQGAPDANPG